MMSPSIKKNHAGKGPMISHLLIDIETTVLFPAKDVFSIDGKRKLDLIR